MFSPLDTNAPGWPDHAHVCPRWNDSPSAKFTRMQDSGSQCCDMLLCYVCASTTPGSRRSVRVLSYWNSILANCRANLNLGAAP